MSTPMSAGLAMRLAPDRRARLQHEYHDEPQYINPKLLERPSGDVGPNVYDTWDQGPRGPPLDIAAQGDQVEGPAEMSARDRSSNDFSCVPSTSAVGSPMEPSGTEKHSMAAVTQSTVCPICRHQLQDRPGLRHHLDIHDPVKVKRYRCDYEGCYYASRYPKDVRRHTLIHGKPTSNPFICDEPGCDRAFHRNDFLIRHRRRAHPDSQQLSLRATGKQRASGPYISGSRVQRTVISNSPGMNRPMMTSKTDVGLSLPNLLRKASSRMPRMAFSQPISDMPRSSSSDSSLAKDSASAQTPASSEDRSADLISESGRPIDTAHEHASYNDNIVSTWTYLTENPATDATSMYHPDENDSSDAESIFSQESVASTATSLGGGLDTANVFDMVDRITSSLLSNEVVTAACSAAVEDPDIGLERYRRNVRRMIKTFGKELRAEAGGSVERRIAITMQTRRISTHVAHRIMTKASSFCARAEKSHIKATYRAPNESPNEGPNEDPNENLDWDNQSDTSGESTNDDGEAFVQEPANEAQVRSFIFDSKACLSFMHTLVEFVHKPYETRLLTTLDVNVAREAWHSRSLMNIIKELSWTPTGLISFSHDRSSSTADRVKSFVEDLMDERWNWSPLAERRHHLQADHFRLSWRSPDGRAKNLDLPEHVEVALQDALKTAPPFINRIGNCGMRSRPANGGSYTGYSSPAAPLSSYQTSGGVAPTSSIGSHGSWQPPGMSGPMNGLTTHPYGPNMPTRPTEHYIYLCVEAGSRKFIGLDCQNVKTDVQFFDLIKSEYKKARGWFRLYFSTWCYDHCEFFQFQKTCLGSGARLNIAFPEPTDPLYEYHPKPLDALQLPPNGPISPDEFYLHYYHQICPSLLSWQRYHRRQMGLMNPIEKEAFEAAPKRVVKLNMQNGRRERFYGLYAKEKRSFERVAIHLSLCCVPGVIFFFLWLFEWKHGLDLQGAAVPIQLSLTLTAAYLGALYWTR